MLQIYPPPTTRKNMPTSVNFAASHSFHANNIIKEHFTTTEKTASGRWCELDHGPLHLPTSRPPSLLLAVPAPNACAEHYPYHQNWRTSDSATMKFNYHIKLYSLTSKIIPKPSSYVHIQEIFRHIEAISWGGHRPSPRPHQPPPTDES